MDLSIAAHSHLFQHVCSCYRVEDNGTRIGLYIGDYVAGKTTSLDSDHFFLPNMVATKRTKQLERGL